MKLYFQIIPSSAAHILENKYDALGRPFADMEREMVRQRKKVLDMEKEVEETVKKASDGRSLNRTLFYV